MQKYLQPTYFLDFDNSEVQTFAQENSSKEQNNKQNAIQLYYAVRDRFKYNPYKLDLRKIGLKASSLLKKKAVTVSKKPFFWRQRVDMSGFRVG